MASKENLLEGFWDHLITKVKQGALATATAAGSSGAQGKLSASLLGTELYRQYKNWLGKTGGDSNPQAFVQFASNLGFSKGFINDQAKAFGDFLQANQKQDKGEKFSIDGNNNNQQQPEKKEPTLDGEKPQEPAQAEQPQQQNQQAQANKPMTPGEKQRAMRAQQRQNMRRESFEFSESAILNEVSDMQLRQFFTQMAQKAFANGEARSAAKHELQTAIVTPTDYKPQQSQGQSQQAPQPQQAQPQQPAPEPQAPQTAQPQEEPAPQKQSAPVQTSGDGKAAFNNPVEFTPEEKEILNMIPGAGLEKQITAKDPAVQELARKVMKDAILKYQKENPPTAPKKQQVKKPQPQAQAAEQNQAQPEQNKPESPQA